MFKVVGIEKIIPPETAMQEISSHWETFYQVIQHVPGEGLYAVYDNYEGNFMKPYRYTIGRKVPSNYKLTEQDKKVNFVLREIPDVKYEVVTATGHMPFALVDKWKMIWMEKEDRRNYTLDYEFYKKDDEVDIHVAVRG